MTTPTTQPAEPLPAPPLTDPAPQFEQISFWESPASYIAVAVSILPVLNLFFHFDAAAAAQTVSVIAPVLAGAVLIAARVYHRVAVLRANTNLVMLHAQTTADAEQAYFHEHFEALSASDRARAARTYLGV